MEALTIKPISANVLKIHSTHDTIVTSPDSLKLYAAYVGLAKNEPLMYVAEHFMSNPNVKRYLREITRK